MRSFIIGCWLLAILAINCFAAPPNATWFPKAPSLAKPTGQVIHVADVDQLLKAAKDVLPNGTISVADGHYRLPRYFEITADGVTLRSASGNRDKVILDGITSRHGEILGIAGCSGVTIADLTIQNIKWNGIKINSHRKTHKVTIHNCVIHNIWQRGVKASAVPRDKQELSPRDCRIQYCLFYNDRAKQFADDETDTEQTFNGNYIGGIDVKNTINWKITDNVFIGIQGRTREGRACIYISENGRGCVIERNIFLDCDIAIALGNPTLGYSPMQAINCVARNNFVSNCPETGILACYTRDCVIANNTIHNPKNPRNRLLWAQKSNEGLKITDNLIVGPAMQITSKSNITQKNNVTVAMLSAVISNPRKGIGQQQIPLSRMNDVITFFSTIREHDAKTAELLLHPGIQTPACLKAMKKLHAGFKGQRGYVAQFGDSITFSMAFWSSMAWSDPAPFIPIEDGLPKRPKNVRWRDYVKGARNKGAQHGNNSGWTAMQMLKNMDEVLQREKPEVAIIMIGTNDIAGGKVPRTYKNQMAVAVKKCIDAHCIPILNTIPPRRGRDDAVTEANAIIRETAREFNVPLADFHSECLRLRLGKSWDGTVISKDGVHPTGGKTNVYTEDNMKQCGYALRNWVNFIVFRQLYFRVLNNTQQK